MKLSAPPPPPPPSDGTPGAGSPGTPDDQPQPAPSGATSGPPAGPDPPSPAPAPKQATWPAWHSRVDAAIVGLVVAFAFVAASFVAHNSDLWIHLAAGKRLFAGEYVPGGGDPFSYSAEGRTWVNHSWLADAFMYLLYGGTGKVLVGAKALVVALAFGLLIAIRRPQFSLWPWAGVACMAVLAAAPQFTLRSSVVSLLLLAVTLYLLFRVPHKKDSWRFPGAIGITFWVWANCDQWFFIGPLALALLLLGDLIQRYGFNAPDEPEGAPDADPLGRLPDTLTLAKALGIGLLACTLTPHHVRVWEPPFELVGAPGADGDPALRVVLLAPTGEDYINKPERGYNLNGLAYVLLLVVGAAVVGLAGSLGVGRLRVAHVALWVGFVGLSLMSVYTIPFFALVAVPLVASQLNAFGTRAELKTWGDPRTRLILIGSSAGRVLSVLAVCLLCVLAYPGWVHPDVSNPVFARRVAWAVEPDPALVQAAEQLKQWRATDALPDDARGFLAHTDLANYAAWYAPQEKVFVNSRFTHHRRELGDYVKVRKGLGIVKDDAPDPKDATDVFQRLGAEYIALSGQPPAPPPAVVLQLYLQWGTWSTWYLDGRTAIFGWRPEPSGGRPSFAALRLDPVAKAFGPTVKKVSDSAVQQLLAPVGWEEAFVRAPRAAPTGASECLRWLEYKQALARRQQIRAQVTEVVFYAPVPRAGHTLGALGFTTDRRRLPFPPPHKDSEADVFAIRAIPFLAVRAARRAIAEDPDHPDAYYALAQALRDPDLPLTESERALGAVTALHQCLVRLPKPDQYKRGQFAVTGLQVALELTGAYLGQPSTWRDPATKKEITGYTGFPIDLPGLQQLGQAILVEPQGRLVPVPLPSVYQKLAQAPPGTQPLANGAPYLLAIDTARDTLQLAIEYADIDTAGETSEMAQKVKKNLESQLKTLETEKVRYQQRYDAGKGAAPKLPDLVNRAIMNSMIGEARDLLNGADAETLKKDFGKQVLFAGVQRVMLELAIGRLEDADFLLKELSDPENAGAIEGLGAGPHIQMLKYQKAILAGEYEAAGKLIASLEVKGVGLEALTAELAKARIDPNKRLLAELGRMPPPVAGGGLLPSFLTFRFSFEHSQEGLRIRSVIANKMQQDAEFFVRRGVLALFQGDIAAAKDWFKQAERKPPPDWRLNTIMPPEASLYLKLIDRAEKAIGP